MKNSQKGFVVPLIIVIAVLAIGGGVYYFSQKKIGMDVSNSSNVDQKSVAAESSTHDPFLVNSYYKKPTLDWKSYSNKNLGITLEYPSMINLTEEQFFDTDVWIISLKSEKDLDITLFVSKDPKLCSNSFKGLKDIVMTTLQKTHVSKNINGNNFLVASGSGWSGGDNMQPYKIFEYYKESSPCMIAESTIVISIPQDYWTKKGWPKKQGQATLKGAFSDMTNAAEELSSSVDYSKYLNVVESVLGSLSYKP